MAQCVELLGVFVAWNMNVFTFCRKIAIIQFSLKSNVKCQKSEKFALQIFHFRLYGLYRLLTIFGPIV